VGKTGRHLQAKKEVVGDAATFVNGKAWDPKEKELLLISQMGARFRMMLFLQSILRCAPKSYLRIGYAPGSGGQASHLAGKTLGRGGPRHFRQVALL
jgi:hypothetical protein